MKIPRTRVSRAPLDSFTRHLLILIAVFGVAATAANAQSDVTGEAPVFSRPDKLPTSEELEKLKSALRMEVELVTTPVTVVNADGEFVYDLEERDFEILDNGIPQTIDSFELSSRPLSLVVLIQTSRRVEPLLPRVHALGSILESLMLGPEGEVAVIFFSDRVDGVLDFTQDMDELDGVLRSTRAKGAGARLNDALSRAVSLLRTRTPKRKRVALVFSDGFDSGSETAEKELLEDATGAEVSIYGVGFSPAQALLMRKPDPPRQNPLDSNVTRPLPPGTVPTPSTAESVYGANVPIVPILVATGRIIRSAMASSLLELYAGYTGGVFYGQWTRRGLEAALSRISEELQSQYDITYVPRQGTRIGFHRIQVRLRQPGLIARARAGYFYTQDSTP